MNLANESFNLSMQSGEKIAEAVPTIEKTTRLVQEIAASSNEQKSGANQINSAILQLNEVTQQNATSAEELTSSAEELSNQADHLNEVTAYFNVGTKTKKITKITHPKVDKPSLEFSKTYQSKTPKMKSELNLIVNEFEIF